MVLPSLLNDFIRPEKAGKVGTTGKGKWPVFVTLVTLVSSVLSACLNQKNSPFLSLMPSLSPSSAYNLRT